MKKKRLLIVYVALVLSIVSFVMSLIAIIKVSKTDRISKKPIDAANMNVEEKTGEDDFKLTLIRVRKDWDEENGGFYATEYEAEFKHEYQDSFDKCRYVCTKREPNLLEHIGGGDFDVTKLKEIEEIIKRNGLVWFEEEVVDENGKVVYREIDRDKTKVYVNVEINGEGKTGYLNPSEYIDVEIVKCMESMSELVEYYDDDRNVIYR